MDGVEIQLILKVTSWVILFINKHDFFWSGLSWQEELQQLIKMSSWLITWQSSSENLCLIYHLCVDIS